MKDAIDYYELQPVYKTGTPASIQLFFFISYLIYLILKDFKISRQCLLNIVNFKCKMQVTEKDVQKSQFFRLKKVMKSLVIFKI